MSPIGSASHWFLLIFICSFQLKVCLAQTANKKPNVVLCNNLDGCVCHDTSHEKQAIANCTCAPYGIRTRQQVSNPF